MDFRRCKQHTEGADNTRPIRRSSAYQVYESVNMEPSRIISRMLTNRNEIRIIRTLYAFWREVLKARARRAEPRFAAAETPEARAAIVRYI